MGRGRSHEQGHDIGSTELKRRRRGFEKITLCAEQTMEHDPGYFWVDTCCINKSSSAELSEAINPMFRWYRDSEICYAYLDDFLEIGMPVEKQVGTFSQYSYML
jgi:hypothetical protein